MLARPSLDCLLITYPIERVHSGVLDQLRALFPVVHFYPGPDGSGTDTEYGPVVAPPAEVLAEADVILGVDVPETLKDISQTPRLKLWQTVSSGVADITESAFYKSIPPEHPLVLSNIAGFHAVCIAQHVMMMALNHYHRMATCAEAARKQHWAGPTEMGGLFIREFRDLTFGLLTYGHIAREIARLATAFGARVVACTRTGAPQPIGGFHIEGTGDEEGTLPSKYFKTDKEGLHAFLGECDVVVDMMPGGPGTYQMISTEEFKAMKDDALFINCGRGTTVDTDVLMQAVSSKAERRGLPGSLAIGGAALDVVDPEPLPDGHPLFSLPNVILTPHSSWATVKLYERTVELIALNKEKLRTGDKPLNAIPRRLERL
ncbi:hypothetical protein JCM10207_008912 [Rhodosporidiobolus poonsookiae]